MSIERWAKLAGLEPKGKCFRVECETQPLTVHLNNPMALPYIAELLKEKAREKNIELLSAYLAQNLRPDDKDTVAGALEGWEIARPEDICRAAEQVLNG